MAHDHDGKREGDGPSMQGTSVRPIHKTPRQHMTTQHFDDDALIAFLDEARDFMDIDAARAHITECQRCSSRLDSLRDWENLLRDPEVWPGTASPQTLHDQREGSTNPGVTSSLGQINAAARNSP